MVTSAKMERAGAWTEEVESIRDLLNAWITKMARYDSYQSGIVRRTVLEWMVGVVFRLLQ
jgi:hypothetical protein